MNDWSYVERWSTHGKFVSHEAWMESYFRYRGKVCGHLNSSVLLFIENGRATYYYDQHDMNESAKTGEMFYLDDQGARDEYEIGGDKACEAYLELCQRIALEGSRCVEQSTLIESLIEYFERHVAVLGYYKLSSEEFCSLVETKIELHLRQLRAYTPEMFQVMTAPDSGDLAVAREREEWLSILRAAQVKGASSSQVSEQIEAHTRKYGFLGAAGGTPQGWSRQFFMDRLRLAESKGLRDSIASVDRQIRVDTERLKGRDDLIASWRLPEWLINAGKALRSSARMRMRIRECFTQCAFLSNPMFQYVYQVARRKVGFSQVGVEVLRQLSLREMIDILNGNGGPDIDLLVARYRSCVYGFQSEKRIWQWDPIESGKMRDEFLGRRRTEGPIKGRVAHRGPTVAGRARVMAPGAHTATKQKIASEMVEGEILVTGMTHPNIIVACEKAGAIVTDQGGVTCHAAIVSRELDVPCIIGTGVATRRIATGDLLRVDTVEGTVTVES